MSKIYILTASDSCTSISSSLAKFMPSYCINKYKLSHKEPTMKGRNDVWMTIIKSSFKHNLCNWSIEHAWKFTDRMLESLGMNLKVQRPKLDLNQSKNRLLPLPRSSGSACTTTARPSIEWGPFREIYTSKQEQNGNISYNLHRRKFLRISNLETGLIEQPTK